MDTEVDGAVKGFKADATKWVGKKTYPFILLAVNIPGHFKRAPRSRQTYEPKYFAHHLMNKVKDSSEFQKLNGQGAGVAVIKRIDGGTAQLIELCCDL
ncbi:MAG: hypothetical protein ICV76_02005 [Nitrospiraceae bacterium]|nr:hypothetical protein [Nitrospiraceae bacterium]